MSKLLTQAKAKSPQINHKEVIKDIILNSPNGIKASDVSTELGVIPETARRIAKKLIAEGEIDIIKRPGRIGNLYISHQ